MTSWCNTISIRQLTLSEIELWIRQWRQFFCRVHSSFHYSLQVTFYARKLVSTMLIYDKYTSLVCVYYDIYYLCHRITGNARTNSYAPLNLSAAVWRPQFVESFFRTYTWPAAVWLLHFSTSNWKGRSLTENPWAAIWRPQCVYLHLPEIYFT